MGTITFTGGSPGQRQAIQAAHSSLATALTGAITAANQGTGSFSGWFGTTGTSQKTAVAAVLHTSQDNLGAQDFSYDLTASLPALLHAPVCVLFANVDASGVSALLWDGLWPTYYLDQQAGSVELALSIAHELLVSFSPGVIDLFGVDGPAAARDLAAVDPAAAARCAASFTGFVTQFLP